MVALINGLLAAEGGFAYIASPPDQPPREITTLEELEDFYRARPQLAKEWQELKEQIKNGDRAQAQPEPEAKSDVNIRPADSPLESPARKEDSSAPGAAAPEPQKSDQEEAPAGASSSPMKQLKDAAGPSAKTDVPQPDSGKEIKQVPVDSPKEIDAAMTDKEKARQIISQIAEAKAEGGKMKGLYEDYLNKVYFGDANFSGPLVRSQLQYIRKGINSGNWKDFPTAAFGGVPAGAAATWEGSGNMGGGHITMAPGLMNMRVFDHEWLHHSDAGHADKTSIGVNELMSVEPPCYKYMGCAPGMNGGC
ncbi:MAG: hypothetical protein WC728_02520 [Elusimicrobiota bacterium]